MPILQCDSVSLNPEATEVYFRLQDRPFQHGFDGLVLEQKLLLIEIAYTYYIVSHAKRLVQAFRYTFLFDSTDTNVRPSR